MGQRIAEKRPQEHKWNWNNPPGIPRCRKELDVGTTSGEQDEIELDENGLPVEQPLTTDELEEDLDGVKVRGKKEARTPQGRTPDASGLHPQDAGGGRTTQNRRGRA